MPRFDPHYLIENGDGTRLREAQSARVNARGHYLGAAAPPSGKEVVKANRARIQSEVNRIAPGLVSVNSDGTLHLNDPISALDQNIASIMPAAVKSAIDGLPSLPAVKTKLKTRPVTFFLDLFDPVLDAMREALEKVMTRGININSAGFKNKTTKDTGEVGIGGFVYDLSSVPLPGFWGNPKLKNINVWLVQPGDEMFDANSQRLILRLRMVIAYIVLFFKKPAELQFSMVRAALEFVFGKPDSTLVSTTGEQNNTVETPTVVDRLPAAAERGTRQNERLYEGTVNNKIVYRVTKAGAGNKTETTYYTLSSKGLADRRAALREDYDRKYAAYVQDFKFWHPDFATRVGVVKFAEGKTEQQAINKVAGEYNLPQRFAEERNLPAKFRVMAPDRLGGPAITGAVNGTRANLQGFGAGRALGALGAGEEIAVAKTSADVSTPVVGPTVAEQVIAVLVKVGEVVGAVVGAITGLVVAVNAPKVAEELTKQKQEQTKQEQIKQDTAREESDRLQSESTSSNTKIALIAGAALVALLIYKGSQNRKG